MDLTQAVRIRHPRQSRELDQIFNGLVKFGVEIFVMDNHGLSLALANEFGYFKCVVVPDDKFIDFRMTRYCLHCGVQLIVESMLFGLRPLPIEHFAPLLKTFNWRCRVLFLELIVAKFSFFEKAHDRVVIRIAYQVHCLVYMFRGVDIRFWFAKKGRRCSPARFGKCFAINFILLRRTVDAESAAIGLGQDVQFRQTPNFVTELCAYALPKGPLWVSWIYRQCVLRRRGDLATVVGCCAAIGHMLHGRHDEPFSRLWKSQKPYDVGSKFITNFSIFSEEESE